MANLENRHLRFWGSSAVYHVLTDSENEDKDADRLCQTLARIFGESLSLSRKNLTDAADLYEIGPLPNFESPWSTNVVSILKSCGEKNILKIEKCRFLRDTHANPNTTFDPILERVYDKTTGYTFPMASQIESYHKVENVHKYSRDHGLTLDQTEIDHYESNVFCGRLPTNVELFDLGQSNSEHSRHWFFNAKLSGVPKSLFKIIKEPWLRNPNNSVVAFCDNASAIECPKRCEMLRVDNGVYQLVSDVEIFPTFTAETHNFPTTFAPFPGANTGIGGCIRDSQAVGRGGQLCASTAGYAVSDMKTLIDASNGASDYGNKIGQPVIQGFSRLFDTATNANHHHGYRKCIMFCGCIGQIHGAENTKKVKPTSGMHIIRIGGPGYRIGLGGGTASSRSETLAVDVAAIQRGDPEMENKMNRVLRKCYEHTPNIILSIHDQGAGGMANVTKEIVSPVGASVYLDRVPLGDQTMTDLEVWCAEYQEQVTTLIAAEDVATLQGYCEEERVPFCDVGVVENSGRIIVHSRFDKSVIVDLDLTKTVETVPQKNVTITPPKSSQTIPFKFPTVCALSLCIGQVLKQPTVGSKRFLTSKVDRSVGLVAQQQCVGPNHTPLADVCVVANTCYGLTGIASAIGEQPIKSLLSVEAMVRLSIAEMLTNLVWANITAFEDVKCSGNWMWPLKIGTEYDAEEGHQLYCGVQEASNILQELGIAIDGGKDSLSMTRDGIKSPETFVISGYVGCKDITKTVTPDLKRSGTILHWLPFGVGSFGVGCTAFAETQTAQLLHDTTPDIKDWQKLKKVFNWIQKGIESDFISSGHDISDGGLITTLIEMAFGSARFGIDIDFKSVALQDELLYRMLFSEEPGLVIECNYDKPGIKNWLGELPHCQTMMPIARTTDAYVCNIQWNGEKVLSEDIGNLQFCWWENYSLQCDMVQTKDINCVRNEYIRLLSPLSVRPWNFEQTLQTSQTSQRTPESCKEYPRNDGSPVFKVGIVREEGSNGDREMAAAFQMAGFECLDLTMGFIAKTPTILETLNGLAFVGGFSYSDCLGAGQGWAAVIRETPTLQQTFNKFRNRQDTFSLSVCNGCQMMALLGWVGDNCKFIQNRSGRFESRFPTVRVCKSPAIMFQGMEESVMGVWCAHGEGQFTCTDISDTVPALQFVDPETHHPTEMYPDNPNGSVSGTTGLCSKDGRHLAMMPHPERSFLSWQLPWSPQKMETLHTMWFQMFLNAHVWCAQANQTKK